MPLVDLSAPIVASPPETPEPLRTEIAFHDHAAGAAAIETLLGVPRRLLRDGEGWATEEFLRFGTHNSTHVDAPYHYNSTIGGQPAQTIDELPLDLFLAPGVVLDFTDRPDGEAITAQDAAAALEAAGHDLQPRDIVLVRSGRDAFLEAPDYLIRGPGVTAEATHWLFDRGVRVMGIDAWGWDAPLHLQAAEAKSATRRGSSGPPIRPTCPTARSSVLPVLARCRPRAFRSPASLFGSPAPAPRRPRRRDRARLMPSPSARPDLRPRLLALGALGVSLLAIVLWSSVAARRTRHRCASSTAATAGRRRCGPAPPAGSRSTGAGRSRPTLGAGRRPRLSPRALRRAAGAAAALGQRRADHRRGRRALARGLGRLVPDPLARAEDGPLRAALRVGQPPRDGLARRPARG
jgi:kynurenine formamidase